MILLAGVYYPEGYKVLLEIVKGWQFERVVSPLAFWHNSPMKSSKSNTISSVVTKSFFEASILRGVSQCHSLLDIVHLWKAQSQILKPRCHSRLSLRHGCYDAWAETLHPVLKVTRSNEYCKRNWPPSTEVGISAGRQLLHVMTKQVDIHLFWFVHSSKYDGCRFIYPTIS